jgi:hypothetical protein
MAATVTFACRARLTLPVRRLHRRIPARDAFAGDPDAEQ